MDPARSPVRIGAHHGPAWAGLVLSPGPGVGFAFRFAVRRAGSTLDLDDLEVRTHEVGPHAPDGRYARVSFDLDRDPERVEPLGDGFPDLTLEWARVSGDGVVGRVRLRAGGATLLLRPYLPWDWTGNWELGAWGCRGHTAGGDWHVALVLDPHAEAEEGDARGHGLRLPAGPVAFAAVLAREAADAEGRARQLLAEGPDTRLEEAWRGYEACGLRVEGPWQGLAAGVTRTLHWMVLLQPETGHLYTPAGRSWVFPRAPERGGGRDHWTLFGWDSFFNALELALEAPDLALDTLEAGLATAYGNGCVPNWRGRFGGTPDRSQPPVGSLAALKVHLRTGRQDVLERTYPGLARWAAWWSAPHQGAGRRGAPVDGLFTWGSDADRVDPLAPPWEREASPRQRAAWESGQDDLPTWDEAGVRPGTGALDLTPVDLNCYRILDEECLARMASRLGLDEAARAHAARAEALRALVNEHLWDPRTESYRDRLGDGSWARCRSASHLLPLTAGVADAERAAALLALLQDPERFWGRWVIPTVSRDDPHFPEQQYWRGTIWPPLNYLIQQGLRRYAFDEAAGAVAARSAELFLGAWRSTGLARENYDARTGEGGGRRHQSWGPLLALLALEELLDVTPWEGLRVGGLGLPARTVLRHVVLRDRDYQVRLDEMGLELALDGHPVLATDGPAVLRHVELEERRVAAHVHAPAAVELRAWLAGERYSVQVDGRRSESGRPYVPLPAGRHQVEVRVV